MLDDIKECIEKELWFAVGHRAEELTRWHKELQSGIYDDIINKHQIGKLPQRLRLILSSVWIKHGVRSFNE